MSRLIKITYFLYLIIFIYGCREDLNIEKGEKYFMLPGADAESDAESEEEEYNCSGDWNMFSTSTICECNQSSKICIDPNNPEDLAFWNRFDDVTYCVPFDIEKVSQVLTISPHSQCCVLNKKLNQDIDWKNCHMGDFGCFLSGHPGNACHDTLEREACEVSKLDFVYEIYIHFYPD